MLVPREVPAVAQLKPLEKVLIALPEVSAVLSLSENTVKAIVATGMLPEVRWGRRVLFAVEDVVALPSKLKERS